MDLLKNLYKNKKLTKKEKKDLMNLSDYIPMYDIYTNKIYFIEKNNLYKKMIYNHYRFIDQSLFTWLKNKYDKLYKIKKRTYDESSDLENLLNNINILKNYDVDVLYNKSIDIMYKYSPEVGLNITICKKKSFLPYFPHLSPYYTKDELINLGLNMGIIKKNISKNILVDTKEHYKICKLISKNDISSNIIEEHCLYILKNNGKYLIQYYSLYGSFFINRILRNLFTKKGKIIKDSNLLSNDQILKFSYKITELIRKAPAFDKEYIVYRFIADDNYLKKLKINDIFIEGGIMSTTRNPFYSNDDNDAFGFILMKIKLPKNKPGIGLNIESLSYFPNEEEIILSPLSRLKLISKDDNFNYYHIDKKFEKKIKKKYEFELVNQLPLINWNNIIIENKNKIINFHNIKIEGKNCLEKSQFFIKNFTNERKEFNLKMHNNIYNFVVNWFDSTGPYEKFYFYKTQLGLSFIHYNLNGQVKLKIEIVDEKISINYFLKWNAFNDVKDELDEPILLDIVASIGYAFNINDVIIHFNYCSYEIFKKNYKSKKIVKFLNCFSFPYDIYNYMKNNKKRFNSVPSLTTNFNYFQIDKMKKIMTYDIINNNRIYDLLLTLKNFKKITLYDFYIYIIENKFFYYDELEKIINSTDLPFNKMYYNLNVNQYLFDKGILKNLPEIIEKDDLKENLINNEDFKDLYRSRFRRF